MPTAPSKKSGSTLWNKLLISYIHLTCIILKGQKSKKKMARLVSDKDGSFLFFLFEKESSKIKYWYPSLVSMCYKNGEWLTF